MKKIARINYVRLRAREQENYNFYVVSGILAEYGFITFRLTNDWDGADFLAHHNDGETYIKVQLKGRFTFGAEYVGKNIHIAFREKGEWYLFPHDKVLEEYAAISNFRNTRSWNAQGGYSIGGISKKAVPLLAPYKIFPLVDYITL